MLRFKMVRQAMAKAREKREEKNLLKDRERKIKLQQVKAQKKLLKERHELKEKLRKEKQEIIALRTAPIRKAAKGLKGFVQQARAKAKKNQSRYSAGSPSAFSLGSKKKSPFDITESSGGPFDLTRKASKPKKKKQPRQIIIKL